MRMTVRKNEGGWRVRREEGREGDVYQVPSGKNQHVALVH